MIVGLVRTFLRYEFYTVAPTKKKEWVGNNTNLLLLYPCTKKGCGTQKIPHT